MKRTLRLPLPAAVLLAAALSLLLTALSLWCQPNDFGEVWERFSHQPILIVLNVLPVGLAFLTASFLCGNLFWGAALTDLVVGGLSIANCVKIQVRDEPVFPRDLSLLKEVGSALQGYEIAFPPEAVWILAAAGGLAALGFLTGGVPHVRKWWQRLTGAALSAAALAALVGLVLSSTELHESLGGSNPYRLSVVFNENGFPYNFCYHFTTYLVDRPPLYSRPLAEAWDGEETNPEPGASVSVVMVMDEAFSDITDDPAFAFSPEDDPLPNLHEIQGSANALSLRLVVPGFAGGTANTEFDVLTGMQTNALGASTTSAMRTVNRNLDSLFRVFGAEGFHTSFFHPGNDWFYNRENVYRWFGAEETRFADEMEGIEEKGGWVTDNYCAALIEEEFAKTAAEGAPLFHYTTTIQNHMGYPLNKYGEGYAFPPVPLAVSVPEEVRQMLEVYVEGVRDADAMLGRLRDFFAAREEPVLLVFFGDHLPYLGDNRLSYTALGMDIAREDGERENWFSIYETPCVIWANDAAAEALDWEAAAEALDLPANGKLSAAFLGAALLELTGRGRANAWTAFLNQIRREMPVVQKAICMLPDGTAVAESGLPEENAALLQKWRQWSYYKLEQKTLR